MTEAQAAHIIADVAGYPAGTLVRSDRLDDIGLDSLDYLEVINKLEDVSGKHLPPERLGSFGTVGELADWFARVQ